MDQCPVCKSFRDDSTVLCNCGYDFEKSEIVDDNKIQDFYNSTKKDWKRRVKFIDTVNDIQQDKYGVAYAGASGGWGVRRTANLLGDPKSTISYCLNIAAYMDFPVIFNCQNLTEARTQLKEIKQFRIVNFKKYRSEKELHNYLETNWGSTPFSREWLLKDSYFNAGDAGQIDLLAHHKEEAKWLVIELKKDIPADKTVAQILRYMGWIKENLARKKEDVEGVIVSGFPPDKNIRLALSVTPNIELRIYRLKDGRAEFMEEDDVKFWLEIWELPINEQKELLKEFRSRYT